MAHSKLYWPRSKAKGREVLIEMVRQNLSQGELIELLRARGVQVSKAHTSRICQGVAEFPTYIADEIAAVLGKPRADLFDTFERPSPASRAA